jgi:hypothetical protein
MDLARRLCGAMKSAEINYRIVGGLAVFFHVDRVEPMAARLTPGADFVIDHQNMIRVAEQLPPLGFELGYINGVHTVSGNVHGSVRTVGHLIFVGQKVRPGYIEPVPGFSPASVTGEGFLVASVPDLVRMKLTSNRIIDKTHLIDMDGVGLITPEIENSLPEALRRRLQQVREEERQSTGAE